MMQLYRQLVAAVSLIFEIFKLAFNDATNKEGESKDILMDNYIETIAYIL